MRLRYTGASPVSFVTLGFGVEPGEEFEVPDEVAAGFIRRADIEVADAPKPPRAAPVKTPKGASPVSPVSVGDAPAPAVTPEEA